MNYILKSILFASVIALPLSARAAYTTNFSDAVSGGGVEGGPTNFGTQGGWAISNADAELSFVYPGVAPYGQSVALGGYYSTPASVTTKLSHSLSEPALNAGKGYFKADFAIINSDGSPGFFIADDIFGFSLSDSSGSLIAINFAPTIDEAVRSITSVTPSGSTLLVPNGISPSGYASPAFYTLTLNFDASGADLAYKGSISGLGLSNFSGVIAGKAGTTFTELAINYTVNDLDPVNAGSNFILVDNISIPEPTVTLAGLMSLGLLTLRRRR